MADRETDLYQVISENAPDAIKTGEIKNHFGRKVAIVSQTSRLPIFRLQFPKLTSRHFWAIQDAYACHVIGPLLREY